MTTVNAPVGTPITYPNIGSTPFPVSQAGNGSSVMLYNQDIVNVAYAGYSDGIGVYNSIPIQPLTGVIMDGSRQIWVFCPTAVIALTVGPGVTQLTPSAVQIAEQIALRQANVTINAFGFLQPSGDASGVTDSNAIAALGRFVYLAPGQFFINTPIIQDNDGMVLQGCGPGITNVRCVFTATQAAMLITGNTRVVQQPLVRDLTLDGNSNTMSGHGWLLRAEVPTGINVEVKNVSGDFFHFSPGDLSTANRDTYEMYNLFGTGNLFTNWNGNGMFLDSHVTSSEIWGLHVNGALVPATNGSNGVLDNGNGNKFVEGHAYAFGGFGYEGVNCVGNLIEGGEWENNKLANIAFNNVKYGRVQGALSYGTVNTGPDIQLTSASNWCSFAGVRHSSVNVSELYSIDGTCSHDSIIDAISFKPIAVAVAAATGSDYLRILANDFQGGAINHSGAHDIVPAGFNN